jgi:hypothetical protein
MQKASNMGQGSTERVSEITEQQGFLAGLDAISGTFFRTILAAIGSICILPPSSIL